MDLLPQTSGTYRRESKNSAETQNPGESGTQKERAGSVSILITGKRTSP